MTHLTHSRSPRPPQIAAFPRSKAHYGFAVLAAALLAACSSKPAESTASTKKAPATTPAPKSGVAPKSGAAATADPSWAGALDKYAEVHNALAADDAARSRKAFGELAVLLGEGAAETAATKGGGTDDIKAQREAFREVSVAVLARLREEGNPGSGELHVAQCPMAFDNVGAQWIQRSKDIANPYFGAAMPGCGGVQESFPAKS